MLVLLEGDARAAHARRAGSASAAATSCASRPARRAPTSSSTTAPSDARFLAVSTHGQPDVVIYPDEGKLSAAERRPDGDGLKMYFKIDDAVPY